MMRMRRSEAAKNKSDAVSFSPTAEAGRARRRRDLGQKAAEVSESSSGSLCELPCRLVTSCLYLPIKPVEYLSRHCTNRFPGDQRHQTCFDLAQLWPKY
ncbi:hypothetical protein EYF80_004746 [Liparis tanakae]|uniref:Uncharacterized protein n=1 Tax=Liparis tanakae TaxID=230148 RepID=A0A4Z2J6I1_9TELE|nr:hypothetical protein EYF80_004746 [Liparis tanakae]